MLNFIPIYNFPHFVADVSLLFSISNNLRGFFIMLLTIKSKKSQIFIRGLKD
jgi:hypothetical protein